MSGMNRIGINAATSAIVDHGVVVQGKAGASAFDGFQVDGTVQIIAATDAASAVAVIVNQVFDQARGQRLRPIGIPI